MSTRILVSMCSRATTKSLDGSVGGDYIKFGRSSNKFYAIFHFFVDNVLLRYIISVRLALA